MYIALAIVAVVVGGFLWLYTGVARGARKRDAELMTRLEPVRAKLDAGGKVTAGEVAQLAAAPELRPLLHSMLRHHHQVSLFPVEQLEKSAQGAGWLAYWLMHPNEAGAAPVAIELVETVARGEVEILVYRCRMPEGHWAGSEWFLGLAGPFADGDPPYERVTAFSRISDKQGKLTPAEVVDRWFVLVHKKGVNS